MRPTMRPLEQRIKTLIEGVWSKTNKIKRPVGVMSRNLRSGTGRRDSNVDLKDEVCPKRLGSKSTNSYGDSVHLPNKAVSTDVGSGSQRLI